MEPGFWARLAYQFPGAWILVPVLAVAWGAISICLFIYDIFDIFKTDRILKKERRRIEAENIAKGLIVERAQKKTLKESLGREAKYFVKIFREMLFGGFEGFILFIYIGIPYIFILLCIIGVFVNIAMLFLSLFTDATKPFFAFEHRHVFPFFNSYIDY